MRYIGVDPGLGGGIACLLDNGTVWAADRMPMTERDVLDLLQSYGEARAVLEFVRTMPKQGIVSAFTFGRGYGGLRMALVAARIPFVEVVPRKWQGALGCLTKGDKNVSKRKAQELFPNIKVTHTIADALLLAEYCRREEVARLTF